MRVKSNKLALRVLSTATFLAMVSSCATAAFAGTYYMEDGSISMVLMDMQMPEMDGCEAAEAIRALPREDALKVPILALTGNSGSDDVERAMAAGMNDFMVKPVQMKLLAQMMSAYLQH